MTTLYSGDPVPIRRRRCTDPRRPGNVTRSACATAAAFLEAEEV